MDLAVAMSEDLVSCLLDALDMDLPDAPAAASAAQPTFADVMQATFQWDAAQAGNNMQLFFPNWEMHADQGQQQQQLQQQQQQQLVNFGSSPFPMAGAATNSGNSAACRAAISSPFAGINAASILQQPAPHLAVSAVPTAPTAPPAATAEFFAAAAGVHSPNLSSSGVGAFATLQQQQQQQQRRSCKRGRPPKADGAYSKGYSTILKYRQRKKEMVSQMEQELAEKLALVQQLQAQQQTLLHKQAMLENSLGAQEALAAQLEALQVSVGPLGTSARTAVYRDAVQVEQLTAAVLLGAPSLQPSTAAAAAGGSGPPLQQQGQQQQQQQQQLDAPAVMQRYRQYIQEVSARLAARAAAGAASAAAAADTAAEAVACGDGAAAAAAAAAAGASTHDQGQHEDTFPAFPFNLVEALSLWKVGHAAGVPGGGEAGSTSSSAENSASAVAPGNASGLAINLGTVNLQSFLHDVVPAEKWRQVAQQLDVEPQQREQLKAAWQLFASAVKKLNVERQQLVQRLQQKLEEGKAAAAAAAEEGAAAAAELHTAAAARIGPRAPTAGVLSSGGGCVCSPLCGSDLQGYMDLANAVEWNLVRGRAMVMLFGWSMLCVLTHEQVARMCVASWPHFPLIRAVAGVLVAGADQEPAGAVGVAGAGAGAGGSAGQLA